MPNPSDYSSEGDFVSACIQQRQDEHPEEDSDQSAAICYSMWSDKMSKPVVRKVHVDVGKAYDVDGGLLGMEFILSDATPDRYDDVILADGWDLRNFQKNPIALFNHNPDFPVGRWEGLNVKNGGLRGHLTMAPAGTSPRHDELRALVDAGILRAVSVGFRPVESKPRGNGSSGLLYTNCELVETSLVSVPANPNALAVAKSLKISDATLSAVFAEQGSRAVIDNSLGNSVTWQGKNIPTRQVFVTEFGGQKIYRY